jgi:hypothetical protein
MIKAVADYQILGNLCDLGELLIKNEGLKVEIWIQLFPDAIKP